MPLTSDPELDREVSDLGAPGRQDSGIEEYRGTSEAETVELETEAMRSPSSPRRFARETRWDQFVLFNFAVPLLLIGAGVGVIRLLGRAEAKPLPPPDLSPAAVLKSLPAAEVEQIRSLQETGQQLEMMIDGTVVPFREARVSSEVAGRVIFKSANCEAGAIVQQGEVLMRIDPTDYEFEVERLTRSTEEASRMLDEVDQEAVNTERLIEVAKRDVQLQEKEVNRQVALKRFGSEAELDRARSALLQSEQQLVSLKNQLELLRSRRSRLESTQKLAETQLRVAEVNLRRCEVTAPISGVIVSEQADLNTFVNRGNALVVIEDTSKAEVAANMRMDQLQWVLRQNADSDSVSATSKAGYDLPDTPAIIEFEVAGRPGAVQRWDGMLVSYDGLGIDPNTRTVPVRILVDNPNHYWDDGKEVEVGDHRNALLRGMFVRVRLQLQPKGELIAIPARALRPGNRVWRFQKDETVLAQRREQLQKKAEEASASEDASATATYQADSFDISDLVSETPFDPEHWTPGLVTFSKRVFPIDSLRLSEEQPIDDVNALPEMLDPSGRIWICEADKTDLSEGDYVVVSPLDSIPPQGLPVRAETKQ